MTVDLTDLARRLRQARRTLVLTGAGCSAPSGIPVYRDPEGRWAHRRPVHFGEFVRQPAVRRRYWAGSLLGWRRVATASPNAAHRSLALLQSLGRVGTVVTQNVDRLHQRAGSEPVLDLHGRIDRVLCLACRLRFDRAALQSHLEGLNPSWATTPSTPRPDGDAAVSAAELESFRVPECPACGGTLKPDVVFFGEPVPGERVRSVHAELEAADLLLVIGSSLMVWSGYRFVRRAAELGVPVAAVNLGRTRADELLSLKISAPCEEVLPALLQEIGEVSCPP